MRNFEERKAEIFCRAQKQREKEKKARRRAWGVGVVTAFCLCITVGVVLHTPELQEDMITDAESKGNAPAPGEPIYGDTQKEENADFDEIASVPEISASDEGCGPVSESDEIYCSEEEVSEDEMAPEDVAPEAPPKEEENDMLSECLGAELALLRVNDAYHDYLYDDFGNVLLAECDVLYMASDSKEKERVKLVLPMFYADQVAKGDALVVLLAEDDAYDTLLRDDTVCILGKSEYVFEELECLALFSAEMTEDEALEFFENFGE